MNKFYSKGYGRIYTNTVENVHRIDQIIKEMDEYEHGYLPRDLITVFDGVIQLVYNGKFDDLDLNELMERCWKEGIYAFYSVSRDY